jgi:zona occludens toxin
MLIFNQGIPRSGKSYDAMRNHIIPALKKGRHVFARLNGLNFDQIATLAGVTVPECCRLLTHIPEEKIPELTKLDIPVGSLVVLDEAQNFWPNSRAKLSPDVIKFVSEHGHKGLDILLMGQDIKDVHSLWRRRVSQVVVFNKLDMLGFPNKYSWALSKAVSPDVFQPVSNGQETYDTTIFGSYRSFVEGAESNQLYADKRASIWNRKFFKFVVPLGLIVVFGAVWYLWHIFHSDSLAGKSTVKTVTTVTRTQVPAGGPPSVAQVPQPGQAPPAPPVEKKYEKDFIQDLSEKHRLRITAVIQSGKKIFAMFEWYDDGLHVKERLSYASIVRLGYAVEIFEGGETATIAKGKVKYVATQFPLEQEGRISDAKQNQIAGANRGVDSSRGFAPSGQPVPSVATKSTQADATDGYGLLGKKTGGVRLRPVDG